MKEGALGSDSPVTKVKDLARVGCGSHVENPPLGLGRLEENKNNMGHVSAEMQLQKLR